MATVLLAAGVVAPAMLIAWCWERRSELIALTLDATFLGAVAIVGVLAIVARLVAIAEVGVAFRGRSGALRSCLLAALVVVVGGAPVWSVAADAASARSSVANVFESGSSEPLYVPATTSSTVTGSSIDPSAFTTVLIIGGDAGPGRWGMRTDTMMLAMIHQASGRMGLVSVPRNLTSLRFPPGSPLAEEFPNGFDDLANALFTHVNTNPALVGHYGQSGRQAEAMALVEAVGYSLNVRIDDFALVNMQGFTTVIDALGGVSLELGQSVPLPPSLPGERPLPPSIGPGLVDMDGAMAIAYARSRSDDSDYERMARQRQLLAALGTQISPTSAARAFGDVTGTLEDSMRTSLSASEFDDLLGRFGDNAAITESVGLAPPLIQPGSPDYMTIAIIVAEVQQSLAAGTPSGYGQG